MTTSQDQNFRVFLLRHAHAGWPAPGTRDHDRPLDERGIAEARAIAALMAQKGFQPDHVCCSSATRCRQTMDLFEPQFRHAPEITIHEELYTGGPDAYLDLIAANAGRAPAAIMIIGHNPMLEETALLLLKKDRDAFTRTMADGFPTAGLLAVEHISAEFPAVEGHARYVDLLDPVNA